MEQLEMLSCVCKTFSFFFFAGDEAKTFFCLPNLYKRGTQKIETIHRHHDDDLKTL